MLPNKTQKTALQCIQVSFSVNAYKKILFGEQNIGLNTNLTESPSYQKKAVCTLYI